ncbi:hypothetical protein KTO58_25460 [Chitinophaga pendula]|uniref:LVIVD repeat-containing protein n=1 Tax=Chitinophaga TaxID=79328 RepID=UPI000BAF0394|nr:MULTISPECIES: hypothetical protein [Chitinophaga]ASZ10072.1 hypothetical protein CK934_03305 [Chitinophaga sp. MD30]UCJ06974.1 hypothetical protein KTO58_25460 [Chitinophaga pendula]
MKLFFYKSLVVAFVAATLLMLVSCHKDKPQCNRVVSTKLYKPVYMSMEKFRSSIKVEPPHTITTTGKIFLYEHYLLVNEPYKGVHIIDNRVPSAPVPIAFINIMGNVDIAVKDNVLYADSYIDMVTLDISDPTHVSEIGRVKEVFPRNAYVGDLKGYGPEGLVVDVTVKDTVYETSCDGYTNGFFLYSSNDGKVYASSNTPPTAKGGSMARFAIMNNYLYAVDHIALQTFDISNPKAPVTKGTTVIGPAIETIFPYRNNLFIGSQVGMFIFDASNPANPVRKGAFSHARQCDPVVIEGDIAYVTLRGGTNCGGVNNQLDVLDVKDISNPKLIRSYPMTNPHGLGIDNGKLFICEGKAGLRFLTATQPATITTVKLLEGPNTFDVIPHNNVLLVSAEDGIYQYDYSQMASPVLLSKLNLSVKR